MEGVKTDNDEICIDANIFSQILSFGLNETEKITIHFKEDNFKRTNENNTFSQKVNDKALVQQKTNETFHMFRFQ